MTSFGMMTINRDAIGAVAVTRDKNTNTIAHRFDLATTSKAVC
jgi:hypothetical protein